MQDVVGEVFLDHVAAVAEADHEIRKAVVAIDLHDVPEDRPPADFDHRLGSQMALFRDARAVTTGEYDDFHAATSQ
ncbi:hypothetical protein D9M70_575650 [compost metagenome]